MDHTERLVAHYSQADEASRLYATPRGILERLRTWDLLERWLPAGGVVYDIGGGAGVHATWLAERGHHVELFEPVPEHVSQASASSEALPAERRFGVTESDARSIPRENASADVVLLLGPLYHLIDVRERTRALDEASRLLKPGGVLVAAGISRFAWLMDAYRAGVASDPEHEESTAFTVRTGRSNADPGPGAFWAYFHRPHELADEITIAGFDDVVAAGVEGFAWMLPDLGDILEDPDATQVLCGQLRRVEHEPSLLGASAHVLVRATTAAD